MPIPIVTRFRQAWSNAFRTSIQFNDPVLNESFDIGPSTSTSPSRERPRFTNERTIVTSIYTRIAIDVAAVLIKHIKLDDQNRYSKDIDSDLNLCLNLEPNIDQGPRQFRQNICSTLFDKGVAVIVPVDYSLVPDKPGTFEIHTLRVGDITAWYPRHVKVNLYNEATGVREEILLQKRFVAIIENPLYPVMNEPNSTLQRLIRKLSILDAVDEQSGSGKLDLIIQLPYVIKSEARRQQAEARRKDIEFQLKGSQYGIAYTDGTEKITQLNRPAENNLLGQIEYLAKMLYGQLGITEDVMNGTADEEAMLNYYNRTIEPILDAITEAMQRSFVGIEGTKDKQRIWYFRDYFRFVPVGSMADIADKFTRNEIVTSNEFRGFMGMAPADDPKADQLINSNMPQQTVTASQPTEDSSSQTSTQQSTGS